MAKFVIAGKADCPYFAKSELLADDLQLNLPEFTAHKISIHPEKWQVRYRNSSNNLFFLSGHTLLFLKGQNVD